MFFREDDERLVNRFVHFHLNLFFVSKAPIGYNRIKVSDEGKERPSLEIDAATTPVLKETFGKSQRGSGFKQLSKELSDRGITSRGKRRHQGGLHYLPRNEAHPGTAVWGCA